MGCVGKDREILCQEYSILINYSYVGGWGTLKDESTREKSKPNLKPAKINRLRVISVQRAGSTRTCTLRFHYEN